MACNRRAVRALVGALAALGVVMLDFQPVEPLAFPPVRLVPEAEARIGQPWTPLSVGGVARRTTRRVIRRSAIYVATLPAACTTVVIENASLYSCGGSYYQPYGNQYVVVYVD